MNPYRAIVAARFRTLLQYRGAAVGGVFTQTCFAFIRIMILDAFYRSSATSPPLGPVEMVGYIWLGQATFTMFPWNVDPDIRDEVRSGDVVYQLCRPLGLYPLWFSRALAWRTAPVLLRLVPMAVVAMGVLPLIGLGEWRLRPPAPAAGAAWLTAMVGAVALACAFTTLLNVTLFWTVSGQGIAAIAAALATLLGGLVIPLPLYPDWAQPVLLALPFAGIQDLPARLYTGNLPPAAIGWIVPLQLGWTAVLAAIGWWALSRMARRVVVQGG